MPLKIYILDPLVDSRWEKLTGCHPNSSVFHQRGWLEALALTYGYKPYVLTTTAPGEQLQNGIVVCRVESWITGTRLVSLPFSDHCEPLTGTSDELREFMTAMQAECDLQKCQYIEIRPLSIADGSTYGLRPSCSYWFHELDICPGLDRIFQGLHNNSFRRNIQKAERERLSYEVGQSEELFDEFYGLLLITRRRHQLLPQPRTWFRHLRACMRDKVQVRIARKNGVPIAAMLTLQHRESVVYKYGCSDERFHSLGGMPFLFWKLVEESKAAGRERIDLGRTDMNNGGLVTFKDRIGASKRLLRYFRYAKSVRRSIPAGSQSWAVRQLFSLLPGTLSSAAGRVLYRHMG